MKFRSSRLEKPLILFDGDCYFCRFWIQRWNARTENKVGYAPYQDRSLEFKEIPMKEFERSVQLVMPTGNVYSGAEATFRALAEVPSGKKYLWAYQHIPLVKQVSELLYRWVASNRSFFSKLTKLVWGDKIEPESYFYARRWFLRGLGLIYAIAFFSLAVQVLGLIGSEGILPVDRYFEQVQGRYGSEGFLKFPSLFWFKATDGFLQVVCWGGGVLALCLLFGFAQPPLLVCLWGLYLSLFTAGQIFLGYQWDILLLEVGFLAIFMSPLQLKPNLGSEAPPSKLVLFLFKLLLFKLMFSSGVVKIISNDTTWTNLTALNFHYETQPIPTWISWYVHQSPEFFQKMSVGIMFFIELFIPFLLFLPRRIRTFSGGVLNFSSSFNSLNWELLFF